MSTRDEREGDDVSESREGGAVVYVSGLPGVGKTTVVKHLVGLAPHRYVRLSFGEALRGVAAPDLSVEAFREAAPTLLNRAAIEAATVAAGEQIAIEYAAGRAVLIDSHAVTPTPEGLKATPDTDTRAAAFAYTVIVHLAVAGAHARVLQSVAHEGRTPFDPAEVQAAETIQLAVVTRYASICDCPLYVVGSSGAAHVVAARVEAAIEAASGWR
jgi:adenylate kinase